MDFDLPVGPLDGIACLYKEVVGARARVEGQSAIVRAGAFQALRFNRENEGARGVRWAPLSGLSGRLCKPGPLAPRSRTDQQNFHAAPNALSKWLEAKHPLITGHW